MFQNRQLCERPLLVNALPCLCYCCILAIVITTALVRCATSLQQ